MSVGKRHGSNLERPFGSQLKTSCNTSIYEVAFAIIPYDAILYMNESKNCFFP